MAAPMEDVELPSEIQDNLTAFDDALTKVEATFRPLLTTQHTTLKEQLSPLDKAKVDLTAAYAVNSLFWAYLNTRGYSPKEHGIKQELERIRSYMNRVKELQDRANAPKLDKPASKRFIKSALWQAARAQCETPEKEPSASPATVPKDTENKTNTPQNTPQNKNKKRKHKKSGEETPQTSGSNTQSEKKKRKKKRKSDVQT